MNPHLSDITRRFWPILRAQGFLGSGATLRRINGPLIHVVNVQGSAGGQCFYVNLGVHLDFLNHPSDPAAIDPKKVKEYECAFRDRLEATDNLPSGWNYGADEPSARELFKSLAETWEKQGRQFFERYSEFPESFVRLINDPDCKDHHPATLLILARIAAHLSEDAITRQIVKIGLDHLPESAIALRRNLEEVRDGSELTWESNLLDLKPPPRKRKR